MQSPEVEININDADFNENSSKRAIKIFISEVNDHLYLHSSLKMNHQSITLIKKIRQFKLNSHNWYCNVN